MNKIIKVTALSLLLASSSTLLATDSFVNSIGINLGKSYTNSQQKNNQGNITLGNTPKESNNSIELFAILNPLTDICKEYNMKPYISYTYSKNTDLKHQYLLVGVNKYYNPSNSKVELYTGALLGYGQIDWKYDPLNDSQNKNIDANSFIGGVQAGLSYPVNENLSLNLNTKYLVHNYETKLKTTNANATIKQDNTSSFSFGLIYKF